MRLATKILLAFGLLLLTALGAVLFFVNRTAPREMAGALSQIAVQGARYPEHLLRQVGR